MQIVLFEIEPWEYKVFEVLRGEHELEYLHSPLVDDNVNQYTDVDVILTFTYSNLEGDVLKQFDQLKLIAVRSTGFDYIDLDYCKEQGITVCDVPTYGANTIAEHIFGLLLIISHNLKDTIDCTCKGDFSLQGLQGFDLRGKTLGVIGTENIGRCVIKIAKRFDMEVLGYDVKPDEELSSRLEFCYCDMDELLSTADIITLHIPANKSLHNLFSRQEFAQMKDGVIIINTARGSVIDVHALVQALAEDKVAAAGLDVLPKETSIREEAELLHPFITRSIIWKRF